MVITKIVNPKTKLSENQIRVYFQGSGYESEEDNVINGIPWFLYLTDYDYKEYINNPESDKVRKSLKKQIKDIVYNSK
jgi:hypothetical protein